MKRFANLKPHFPLIRTALFLCAFLLVIGWALSHLQRGQEPIVRLPLDGAVWAPADSFASSSGEEAAGPPDEAFRPYTGPAEVLRDDAPYYWLRLPLPAGRWSDPHLWMLNVASVQIWSGSEQLYVHDLAERRDRVSTTIHWTMAPLPLRLPTEIDLLLSKRDNQSTSAPRLELGDRADLLKRSARTDLDNLILAALFWFSALISLGLYATRRDKLYFYFTTLCLVGGYASFVSNSLLQILWDYRWLSYFHNLCLPLGLVSFIGILEHVFTGPHRRLLSALRRTTLALGLATLVVSLYSSAGYNWLMRYPFMLLLLAAVAAILWTVVRGYRQRQDVESVWVSAGFATMTLAVLLHVVRYMNVPALSKWLLERFPEWTTLLPADFIYWSLFACVISLIRVIIHRYRGMNRQLADFNRSLEQQVEERTAELQEKTSQWESANKLLSDSMRDTAEAMAETMVLEERHRITGAIHDTVGHSLTATIVQLEAAKRLLDRDPEQADAKLEASQELVRRGLDEIRQSVRLLRDNASHYDLAASIGALLRDTQETTGAVIDADIDPLPETLSTLQKKVIYQALQEGLTNGLRHGGSLRFHFSLKAQGDRVYFRLWNDGRTYTPSRYGFGLQAMAERVGQLGGTMTVEPGDPGCKLTLTLPLVS